MFDSLETVTIHKLRGREIEKYIENETGFNPELAQNGFVGGDDSCGFYEVDVKGQVSSRDQEVISDCIANADNFDRFQPDVVQAFLNKLCSEGKIPSGEYQLLYSWG